MPQVRAMGGEENGVRCARATCQATMAVQTPQELNYNETSSSLTGYLNTYLRLELVERFVDEKSDMEVEGRIPEVERTNHARNEAFCSTKPT